MKIGEALTKSGLISAKDLEVALAEQKKTKERLGDIVIKMGFVLPESLAPFLAVHFNLPFVNLKDIYKEIKPEVIKLVPEELARRFGLIPIKVEDNKLTLAMFDPLDVLALDTIRIKTGHKTAQVVAIERDIVEAIEYCYHQNSRMGEFVADFIELESALNGDPRKIQISCVLKPRILR